ncbi:MAG: nucleoside hydrolase [Clostridia bacterium]|nr:nucleoside hydrolase [Clostridia bacterium]
MSIQKQVGLQKIILDTDIGDDIDDAFALYYLLAKNTTEILGVTTVYKNVVERSKIAKRFIRLSQREIPVLAGVNEPLRKNVRLLYGEKVRDDGLIKIDHYTDDLDGESYESETAVDFILRTLKENPNEVTLVAIGPLTNLAKCVKKDLQTFRLAKEILLMGGRFNDKIAEWNIETDPDGAREVLQSGVPCKIVPFDATNRCTLKKDGVEKIRALKGEAEEYLCKMMNRWIEHYDENWRGEKIPVLHDVLAVMELDGDTFFQKRTIRFSLPLQGENADCTVEEENGEFTATLLYDFNQETFYEKFWNTVLNQ